MKVSGAAESGSHRFPNFIIGGAPRCATTWLYMLADRHHEIAMAKPMRPEPKFFLVDELFDRGLEYYALEWFDGLPHRPSLGEKSTNYLESPFAAERIHRSLPDVRLIFILRNPVDRAYSNYLWSRQNGLETMSFEEALALEGQRERELQPNLRYARPFSYFSRGLYADHLARFFKFFPRDQILVLRQEDAASSPRQVAERFQRFVGVAVLPELTDTLGTVNSAMLDRASGLRPELRAALAQRYREPNERLRALLGDDFVIWNET